MDMCLFFDGTGYEKSFIVENLFHLAEGEIHQITGLEIGAHFTNISKDGTDADIEEFLELADPALRHDYSYVDLTHGVTFLMTRFFLAVGDDVYKNRAYILNRFKAMPHGEEYLQLLMNTLTRTERYLSVHKYPTPNYDRMPKTIAEAESYFLTKPDLEESSVAA